MDSCRPVAGSPWEQPGSCRPHLAAQLCQLLLALRSCPGALLQLQPGGRQLGLQGGDGAASGRGGWAGLLGSR